MAVDGFFKHTKKEINKERAVVGRAVASDTSGPRFESVIVKLYIEHLFIVNCIEKTKIKKKRPELADFVKN